MACSERKTLPLRALCDTKAVIPGCCHAANDVDVIARIPPAMVARARDFQILFLFLSPFIPTHMNVPASLDRR